jgi:D-alanyl-lipoteichoic acid acyltransferase DltB (MBOAT superfamily)
MSFVSTAFVIFYPLVLVAYYLLSRTLRLQNLLLLAASLFFYGWWDWRFLFLLLFTSGLDFVVARIIEDQPRWRKAAILTSIGVNLGTLFLFKYFDFFVTSLQALLDALGIAAQPTTLSVILPIGISFYTFQSMAYTIDVYRGVARAERDPLVFFAFISFFPQLVAGPIERANHMLPQFRRPRRVGSAAIRQGVWLIVWGYFLKMVVADSAAPIADAAFRPDQHYAWTTVFGTVAFGMQIFGDFAGYSCIAKGLAALMGFELMWNFREPYWSLSVQEFWQRWHIALSTWLRDYLYIPLGGNRRGRLRTYVNLVVTMALGGLWHGAAWNFVFWGLLHGVALAVHRLYAALKPKHWGLPAPLAWMLTMVVVFTGWFFFRARSWELMAAMAGSLHDWTWAPGHTQALRALLVLIVPIAVVERIQRGAGGPFAIADAHWTVRALVNGAALLAIISLMDRARTEFIYFQF